MRKRVQQGVLWRDELVLRRALCGMALIVAAIGTAGCQHESQAEREEVTNCIVSGRHAIRQTCP